MPVSGFVPNTSTRAKGEPFKATPGMYFVKVVDVDEAPVRDPEKAELYGKSWIWKFLVLDQNFNVMMSLQQRDEEGNLLPAILIQFTSDRLGINPNTKQAARARMFLEGLLGSKLPEGTQAQELVNKALETGVAQAFITQDNKKPEYMTIGSMLPITDKSVVEKVEAALEEVPAPLLYKPQDDEVKF